MTEPINHWKLGLFVVLGVILALAALVGLGSHLLAPISVRYYSAFDEAVTGLDVGSPVRFRGVTVGRVASIGVAPDHRHVEVAYDLASNVLERLRLASDRGEHTRVPVPPDLRAQLSTTGVTGVKYVLLDFFNPATHPVPALSFEPPERYIPTTPSTLKDLEQSVVRAVDRFPALAEDAQQVLRRLGDLLASMTNERLPERAGATLEGIDATLELARKKLGELDAAGISSDARRALGTLDTTLARATAVLDQLSGERGVLASVQRASGSLGDAAGGARHVGPELVDALQELREAAAAFRELLEAMELDPDMLVKGRAAAEAER